MSLVRRLSSTFGAYRYAVVNNRNQNADRCIIRELGFAEYFTDDYGTTGVSGGDVAFLHNYIKAEKPRRVIEFGTGKSTWIIAKCMERYCWDKYGGDIAFVSMEESQFWYEQQLKFIPRNAFSHFDQFVRIIRSEPEIYRFRFAAGQSYKDTPVEHFDFCFIDGPDPHGTCNMDFIKLVEKSERPMTALVDNRKTTQMVYAALFGKEKMTRYHSGLCLVKDVAKTDLEPTRYKTIFPENERILQV